MLGPPALATAANPPFDVFGAATCLAEHPVCVEDFDPNSPLDGDAFLGCMTAVENSCFHGMDFSQPLMERDTLVPCLLTNSCLENVSLPPDSLGFCLLENSCLADIDTSTPLAERDSLVPCLLDNKCLDDFGQIEPEGATTAGQCLVEKQCFADFNIRAPLGERDTLIPCMLEHDCFSDVDLVSSIDERDGLVSCLVRNEGCITPDGSLPININCVQRIPFLNPNPVCGSFVNSVALVQCLASSSPVSCIIQSAATLGAGATKMMQCITDDSKCADKANLDGFLTCIINNNESPFTCLENNFVLGKGATTFGNCALDEQLCGDKFELRELVACVADGGDIFSCVSTNVVLGGGVETLGKCFVEEDKCAEKVNLPIGVECARACVEGDATCILSCGMSAIGIAPGVTTFAGCLVDDQKCGNDLDVMGLVSCLQDPNQPPLDCLTAGYINFASGLMDVVACTTTGACADKFNAASLIGCVATSEKSVVECALESASIGAGIKSAVGCAFNDDVCGDKLYIQEGVSCAQQCATGGNKCLARCLLSAIDISPAMLAASECLVDDDICGGILDLRTGFECFAKANDLTAALVDCVGIKVPTFPQRPIPSPPAPTAAPPLYPTLPPYTPLPPTPTPVTPLPDGEPASSSGAPQAGAIVGGVAGAGLLAAGAALFLRRRKQPQHTDSFTMESGAAGNLLENEH